MEGRSRMERGKGGEMTKRTGERRGVWGEWQEKRGRVGELKEGRADEGSVR